MYPIQHQSANQALFETKMAQIVSLFLTKTAKKAPFGAAHTGTYIAHLRKFHPLPLGNQAGLLKLVLISL